MPLWEVISVVIAAGLSEIIERLILTSNPWCAIRPYDGQTKGVPMNGHSENGMEHVGKSEKQKAERSGRDGCGLMWLDAGTLSHRKHVAVQRNVSNATARIW